MNTLEQALEQQFILKLINKYIVNQNVCLVTNLNSPKLPHILIVNTTTIHLECDNNDLISLMSKLKNLGITIDVWPNKAGAGGFMICIEPCEIPFTLSLAK